MALQKIKFSQFGGVNTVLDSSNEGVTAVRVSRNLLSRPLGALSVPPAWKSFAPGGTILDLGYVTNIDYLFDGARLLLQAANLEWWDVTPDPTTGSPTNTVVTAPGTTLAANLSIAVNQYLAFKDSTGNWRMTADQYAMGWATERLGTVPNYTTRYTADRAFEFGFGPIFTDSAGNLWKLYARTGEGLDAITV